MRFRGFLTFLVILNALSVPTAAQTPTPATTAFDGKYVGTATLTGGGHAGEYCYPIPYADMTITGGQVIIHATHTDGATLTFRGNVNAAGEVSTNRQNGTIDGAIHDKVFTSQRRNGYWCYWSVQMASAPAPMMPFDGWYGGTSREVLDGRSNVQPCYPHALAPPHILRIANGVVETPNFERWEGTVSSQGAVTLHNPQFSRVDARIDGQGTIRGQYSGDIPPRLGGGTNCVVNFVWQKE